MPLFADATSLRALGRIDSIDLLRHYDTDVVLSPWVRRRELRQFEARLNEGESNGWLREEAPSDTVVEQIMEVFKLDRGEAETIDLASTIGGSPTRILIDEGAAFRVALRMLDYRPKWELVCLAQVLHRLEAGGHIGSATTTMKELQGRGGYHWAAPVRRHYEAWCQQQGITPIPSA